jgi:hypothetical protein
LFGVSLSSVKRVTLVWSLSSSIEGKDNRGESINAIVLLYRSNLSYGVKTHPWHVRANGLPKPLEQLQLLLLTEHQFASGHTLKLENEGEHWEEIVRSYLVLAPRRSNSLGVFLEGLERRRREEGVEPLSEEGAPRLANEELHAMRRERTVARAALDPGVPTRVAAYPY